jgi:hypothetical protein
MLQWAVAIIVGYLGYRRHPWWVPAGIAVAFLVLIQVFVAASVQNWRGEAGLAAIRASERQKYEFLGTYFTLRDVLLNSFGRVASHAPRRAVRQNRPAALHDLFHGRRVIPPNSDTWGWQERASTLGLRSCVSPDARLLFGNIV